MPVLMYLVFTWRVDGDKCLCISVSVSFLSPNYLLNMKVSWREISFFLQV